MPGERRIFAAPSPVGRQSRSQCEDEQASHQRAMPSACPRSQDSFFSFRSTRGRPLATPAGDTYTGRYGHITLPLLGCLQSQPLRQVFGAMGLPRRLRRLQCQKKGITHWVRGGCRPPWGIVVCARLAWPKRRERSWTSRMPSCETRSHQKPLICIIFHSPLSVSYSAQKRKARNQYSGGKSLLCMPRAELELDFPCLTRCFCQPTLHFLQRLSLVRLESTRREISGK